MIKRLAAIVAGLWLALAFAAPAWAAPAAGDWLGVLNVGKGVALRIAVHIHRTRGGGFAGVWDSVDQGLYDDPISDVVVAGDNITFKIASLNADYAGQWSASRRAWVGQWTQGGRPLPLDLAPGAVPPAPRIAGLDGEWDGVLNLGSGLKLRLAFHIKTGPHGTLGTWDSVDQGAYGLKLTTLSRQGGHVTLASKTSGFTLEGDLADKGQSLETLFTQGKLRQPVLLKRLAAGQPSPWPAPDKARPTHAGAPVPAIWTLPSDAEIRALLVERVDVQRQGVGIVVGVIDASGRRVVAYGVSDPGAARPLDGDSVFEIGSITKVFTAIVLADMVRRGEVGLDDPIQNYVFSGHVPERNGKVITLSMLATQTSGLPRLPTNMGFKDPANPYADYTEAQLGEFLLSYQLTRDPGAEWEYSNLGFGLLGDLLAHRTGLSYEALVKQRVLNPLGMTSTSITLTPNETARLVVGHDSSLRRVGQWDLPALAGAGGLRSTANDLLIFLAANLGYADTPLKDDLAAALAVRLPTGAAGRLQALGWEIIEAPGGDIVEHGGGTGGYHTFIAFNRKSGIGVVVLTNAETVVGADDIALHLLTGSPVTTLAPPPPAPPEHHVAAIDPRLLDGYVGRYRMSPAETITVTRDGDRLMAQLTGQAVFEIFPEGPRDFFWKVVDAQATFQVGPDGKASALILHQNGRNLTAPRIP